MGAGTLRGPDPDTALACADCGWHGAETAQPPGPGAFGLAEAGSITIHACPRCGVPLSPNLPSVADILAARRTPEA
jgi:hypothetical protein